MANALKLTTEVKKRTTTTKGVQANDINILERQIGKLNVFKY